MDLQYIKQRYEIVGDDPVLNRAIEIAVQVAPTDLSVLVTGESGVGKEVIPQIIHQNSSRKHNAYIAVNCGAIPEGTIDSELFGHEKGSFTGAQETRKGYFEVADGGTIFLDEVAELPLSTQVRLLRVLQSGEFYKVGSSKVQKTNVRVVGATNVNVPHAIRQGKFREDLYYRLNTVPITLPALRERKADIHNLFRKFALDFADKYQMPSVRLTPDAVHLLESYRWPGNIRQLKNVAEQMSVLEKERTITPEILMRYLPQDTPDQLPVVGGGRGNEDILPDREIIYKILSQLRNEIDDLKLEVNSLKAGSQQGGGGLLRRTAATCQQPGTDVIPAHHTLPHEVMLIHSGERTEDEPAYEQFTEEQGGEQEPVMSIPSVNADLIKKCLEKHNGKRKAAAQELGISERTLYRKIKELNLA